MPEIEGGGFVISVLRSMGNALVGYASIEPLSWCEINAYQSATGVRLTAWEAESVRILSEYYVYQTKNSRDKDCPPPYKPELTLEMKKNHARMLRQRMRDK